MDNTFTLEIGYAILVGPQQPARIAQAVHGLTLQDSADEDQIAFPLDLSGVANAAHLEVTWVLRCSQSPIKLAW